MIFFLSYDEIDSKRFVNKSKFMWCDVRNLFWLYSNSSNIHRGLISCTLNITIDFSVISSDFAFIAISHRTLFDKFEFPSEQQYNMQRTNLVFPNISQSFRQKFCVKIKEFQIMHISSCFFEFNLLRLLVAIRSKTHNNMPFIVYMGMRMWIIVMPDACMRRVHIISNWIEMFARITCHTLY